MALVRSFDNCSDALNLKVVRITKDKRWKLLFEAKLLGELKAQSKARFTFLFRMKFFQSHRDSKLGNNLDDFGVVDGWFVLTQTFVPLFDVSSKLSVESKIKLFWLLKLFLENTYVDGEMEFCLQDIFLRMLRSFTWF